MNFTLLFPVIFFIAIVIVIAVLSIKGRGAKDFDERQAMVRGRAANYGYLTTLVLLMPALLFFGGEHTEVAYIFASLAFFGGLAVNAVYNIWNGGFFQLHQKTSGYTVLCFFIAVLNFLTTGMRLAEGESIWEIVTDRGGTNFFLGVLFGIIGVTILVRRMADRREEE
jgi:hypothetical protein